MPVRVIAVDRPEAPSLEMPDRFRHDITYFMSVPGQNGIPALPAGDYWIAREEARRWLEDGTFEVVSPLDSAAKTEVELSEDQELWLGWIIDHDIHHVRIT